MWISKEGDVRKQELLDAALQLFTEKGYEGTSINDIIKKVGVTKGAFYYYFKSKEEVLDILTERQTDIIIGFLQKIAVEENVSVIEKLNRINADAQRIRAANMAQRQAASHAYRNELSIILGIKIMEKNHTKRVPRTCSQSLNKASGKGYSILTIPEKRRHSICSLTLC